MKTDDKNGIFGWKAAGGRNFSLTAFYVGELFESTVQKILLAADGEQF